MPKIIDLKKRSEPLEYGISFAARDARGSYDHAFVVWYYSDPAGKRTVRRSAGFYPTGADTYDLIIGGTPGVVMDDSREKIAQQVTVLIDADVFNAALKIEKQYAEATYRLGTNDCVSFVSSIAASIPGLAVPSRLLNVYPSSFISALYRQN